MQKAKGKTNKLTAKKRRVIADLIIATQCIQTDGSMFLGCSISDKDQSRIVQLIIAKGEKIQKKIVSSSKTQSIFKRIFQTQWQLLVLQRRTNEFSNI